MLLWPDISWVFPGRRRITVFFLCSHLFPLAFLLYNAIGRDFRVTERIPITTTTQPSDGKSNVSSTTAHSVKVGFRNCWDSEYLCCLFSEGAVRLVGGQHQCEGRVEMYLNSGWGTICDDAWDLPDAQVVCRQLGCGEATAARGEAFFGPGSGTILLDNLKCSGGEASLQECSHISWNVHNCDHTEDAGVTCSLSWFQLNRNIPSP